MQHLTNSTKVGSNCLYQHTKGAHLHWPSVEIHTVLEQVQGE